MIRKAPKRLAHRERAPVVTVGAAPAFLSSMSEGTASVVVVAIVLVGVVIAARILA